MTAVQGPAVQRRRLRGELRRVRSEAGRTQREVAQAMDWSISKLIRIESGAVSVSTTDLKALLDFYGVSDRQEVERFVELARAGKDRRGWWSAYREAVSQQYLTFLGHEDAASSIQQFEPLLVPGLLQTAAYARTVLQAFVPAAPGKRIDDWVDLRMQRQQLLERDPSPESLFVLDEAVLRRPVGGPDVMRAQLSKILKLAERPNVTIEVVPFSVGVHVGMKGPFVILEFPDAYENDVLFLENSRGDLISRDEQADIVPYRDAMAGLRELAKNVELADMIDQAFP
jgi:transcriptional regulator with XRE-family HTH domain